ncbi:MAG: prolyl oligopeptidase family serine peptidase, partial [Gammaproteobacteria bacterium]
MAVSPNGRYLAWSSDTDGSERFVMRYKDLETGEALPDEIPSTISQPVWSADSATLLYLVVNENWRPFEVRAHRLGTPVGEDTVVYHEDEESFFVGIGDTQSEQYIVIGTGDHVTSEVRVLPASDPTAQPLLIAPRRENHEYEVDHARGRFWIRTNDKHKNFRVVSAPEDDPVEANWEELIAGSDQHYIRDVTSFENVLVIRERIGGLDQIRLRDYEAKEWYFEFPEEAYAVGLGANEEPEARKLRLHYESMVTPDTVFDYSVDARTFERLKVQEIPSGYDAGAYETIRLTAPARDGASIPVSVVYRKDFEKNGKGLLHLYAYGAYGAAIPPSFSELRLSLLDRGFAYAIAHIRGGDDLGYHWYEQGKLEERTNTFNDFVDVARYLIAEKYTAPGRIAISGRSA